MINFGQKIYIRKKHFWYILLYISYKENTKQSTMKYSFNIFFLILSFFFILIIFTNAGETASLKLSPGWPSDLNKFDVGNFTSTAVGFSNDSLNEKMVFIAQRKKNAYKDCILAFDPNEGKFIKSFGSSAKISSPHGTYFDSARNSLWVADIERHTVLQMLGSNGDVLKEFGTSGVAGKGVHPTLQFGCVCLAPRLCQDAFVDPI